MNEKLDLEALQHELQTQDNRITADPIWIVYSKHEVWAKEGYNDEGIKYLDGQNDYSEIAESYEKLLQYASLEAVEYDLEVPSREERNNMDDEEFIDWMNEHNQLNWLKFVYRTEDRFENVFFTEKAANEWIQRNKHNLRKPYTFVHCLFRNPEMQGLRNALLNGELIYKEDIDQNAEKTCRQTA